MALTRKSHREDQPEALAPLSQLAEFYLGTGEREEALPLIREGVKLCLQVLESEHSTLYLRAVSGFASWA